MAFVASATASSSRSDDDAMSVTSWRRSDKEIDAVPPPPFGLMGVADDLCVARKPHQQTSCYSWDETLTPVALNPLQGVTSSPDHSPHRETHLRRQASRPGRERE